jgi:hypothetical protein
VSLWCRGEYPIDEQCHVCADRKDCMGVSDLVFPLEVWRIVARAALTANLQRRVKAFAWECRVKK